MPVILDQLQHLQTTGLTELESVSQSDALERWRIQYLGVKGQLKTLARQLKDVPKDEILINETIVE